MNGRPEVLEFQLNDKIEFAHKGDTDETLTVYLRGPNYNERVLGFKMKQHMIAASVVMSEKAARIRQSGPQEPSVPVDPDPDAKPSGDEILAMMMAGSPNYAQVIEDFTQLAMKVGYLVEDKINLKQKHIEDIYNQGLIEVMMAEYCSHFFAQSLGSKIRRTGGSDG